jgi:hypothetical protein
MATGFIPGIVRPGRDVDHLPLSNSEVDSVTVLPVCFLVVWPQESYPDVPWKHFSVCLICGDRSLSVNGNAY